MRAHPARRGHVLKRLVTMARATYGEESMTTKDTEGISAIFNSRTKDYPDSKQRQPSTQRTRNRKRPRSAIRSNEETETQAVVRRLQLGGKPIQGSPSFVRIIDPYPYTFISHAKKRQLGRTVFDVYNKEFGSYPASYYTTAIKEGRILVSDNAVDPSYVIKDKDILMHTVHRHEPAVAVTSDQAPFVKVVAETDNLVVLDKPSTLPIHPCGGYHENSLMNMLEKCGYGKLYTIHRLDRLTSGLVILGKCSNTAREWATAIQGRESCEKIYLARVSGKFPMNMISNVAVPRLENENESDSCQMPSYGEWVASEECRSSTKQEKRRDETGEKKEDGESNRQRNAHCYWMSNSTGSPARSTVTLLDYSKFQNTVDACLASLDRGRDVIETAGMEHPTSDDDLLWLHLACPVRIAQHKNGVCECGTFEDLDPATYLKTVKSAETAFAVVHYDVDSDTTLLLCRPITGRTHQIRIHLQYLGHPIANDPNYGGNMWCGNRDGEVACQEAERRLKALDVLNLEGQSSSSNNVVASNEESLVVSDVPATQLEVERMQGMARQEQETLDDFVKRSCIWCARSKEGNSANERTMLEFLVRSPGIWLHALRYRMLTSTTTATKTDEFLSFCTDMPLWGQR